MYLRLLYLSLSMIDFVNCGTTNVWDMHNLCG